MNRLDVTNLVMQRLGKRTGLETDIVAEIQQAQRDLELGKFLPWFLVKILTGMSTTIGSREVNLPSDFLRETEDRWRVTTADGVRDLTKGEYDELYSREIFGADYLESNYYAVVGSKVYIFPTPSAVMPLAGFYFAKDAELSSDQSTNNWLSWASPLLVARTGMKMAKTLRDQDAYNLFKEDYGEALENLISADVVRRQAGLTTIAGG